MNWLYFDHPFSEIGKRPFWAIYVLVVHIVNDEVTQHEEKGNSCSATKPKYFFGRFCDGVEVLVLGQICCRIKQDNP